MAKGTIFIDQARCKGCTLCTTVCPQQILFMGDDALNSRGYHPALLVDPQAKCTGCAICAMICPDACITVFREEAHTHPRSTAVVQPVIATAAIPVQPGGTMVMTATLQHKGGSDDR